MTILGIIFIVIGAFFFILIWSILMFKQKHRAELFERVMEDEQIMSKMSNESEDTKQYYLNKALNIATMIFRFLMLLSATLIVIGSLLVSKII